MTADLSDLAGKTVRTPEGKTYRIPDDATGDQVSGFLSRLRKPSPVAAAPLDTVPSHTPQDGATATAALAEATKAAPQATQPGLIENVVRGAGGFAVGAGKAVVAPFVEAANVAREMYPEIDTALGTKPPTPQPFPPGAEGAKQIGLGLAQNVYVPSPVGPVSPVGLFQAGKELLSAGAPVNGKPPSSYEVGSRLGGAAVGAYFSAPGAGHAISERFRPTPAEVEAVHRNIATPAALPDRLRPVSEQASTELGKALGDIQKAGSVPFRGAGLSIDDAHVIPNLARVFPGPGIANPVRVTVYDNATGQLHSVGLPSVTALREAITRQLPPGLEKPAARTELPAPKPVETKTTLPGPAISPEQYAAAVKAGEQRAIGEAEAGAKKVSAVRQAALEKTAAVAETAPAVVAAGMRAGPVEKGAAALERQIAENPGDARIGRWRRRLEKLKAQMPGPAEQPAGTEGEPATPLEAAAPAKPKRIKTAGPGQPPDLREVPLTPGGPKAPPPSEAPIAKRGSPGLARQGRTLEEAADKARVASIGEPPAGLGPEKPPRRELGKFERGDRVTGARDERGFVLSEVKNQDPLSTMRRYRVRWDGGHETELEARHLKVRAGSARATEAEMKKIEAVPEPTPPYHLVEGKRVEPPPRVNIEGEVAAAVRKRAGLRPIEEMPLRPAKAFVAERSSSNEKFVTDGHMLLLTPGMDAKVRARLHEGAQNKTLETSPKIDSVVEEATTGPMVKLQPRGWATVEGDRDVAVFYDPKSDRLVTADPQKLKLAVKAVSPDTYEQTTKPKSIKGYKGNVEVRKGEWAPIVMRREGKFVGLLMPLRTAGAEAAEIRDMLGAPAKVVTHESRMSGAPAPKRAAAIPPTSPSRGLPIPRTAPRVPTKAEAKTLPEMAVPKPPAKVSDSTVGRVREALHELVAATNPVRLAVGKNLDLMMRAKGGIRGALFRAQQTQRSVEKFWDGQSHGKILDFLTRHEHGEQPDPYLADIAKAYRERADNMFAEASRHKDVSFIENWFPHAWKNEAKARAFLASRRPMEGTKSFLRKRFFEDWNAALKAGLEPVDWNPEKTMQNAEHNVRKFGMVQDLIPEAKSIGSAVERGPNEKVPEGFRMPNQKWAQLYLNPDIQVKEYHDRAIMEGLQSVAKTIGTKLERQVRIGGRRLGYSEAAPGKTGRVMTKFATPESTLAHEIGHQIDSKYGLQNEFIRRSTPAEKRELRALVDLRLTAGEETTAGFKKYIREGPEKMATLLEALIHAPEAFRETAPLNYKKFIGFLNSHDELAPLVHIRPSLRLVEGTGTVSAGGIVLGKRIYFEENLARLLDHHMSQDFISQNKWGRGLMVSRNSLNAINLAVSAFHATGVTLLSIMSRMGVGFSEIAHGHLATGAFKVATSPAAPLVYLRDGWRFMRGAPELIDFEKRLFTAGAALEKRQYFQNSAFDNFMHNAKLALSPSGGTPYERAGGFVKASLLSPFAAIESSMRLLSNYVIPQMKVGAFRDLESSQLRIKAKDIAAGKDTVDNVGRIAWRDVEDRMGQINYDNEFWHNTLKSTIMLLIRSPGWTLGTMRALGGAAFADMPRFAARAVEAGYKVSRGEAVERPPEWTSRMSFALSMTVTTMATGAIYNYLHTGQWPATLEDYLHPRNGLRNADGSAQRVNFPTFFKDVQGWTGINVSGNRVSWEPDVPKEAVGRIQTGRGSSVLGHGGKLAPEIPIFLEFLDNQSYRGPIRNVNDPAYKQALQFMKYVFGSEQPFSIQQAKKIVKERGGAQAAESFAGITPYYPPAKRQYRFHYNEPQP